MAPAVGAEQAAPRITRPLRGNGTPYRGINVLVLWSSAIDNGNAAPVWMTYRQAAELKAQVLQAMFRHALLDYWSGRCPMTGITERALLRASHIKPWANLALHRALHGFIP
jgi:antirestriction protein ArdC